MAEYRYDQDLEFLQYASNDQLAVLVKYLTEDKSGEKRYSESLTSDPEFKQAAGNYKKVWKLIAREIQLYGGDSIVNFFRNTGVLYREVLTDVYNKLNIGKLDNSKKTEEIEYELIVKIFDKAWDKMDDSEKKQIKEQLDISPSASLSDIVHGASTTSLISYQISAIVATMVARIMGLSVSNFFAGRVAAILLGPIGIGVSLLSTVPLISGTAYRVTIPVVIQVAAMRLEYLQSLKQ